MYGYKYLKKKKTYDMQEEIKTIEYTLRSIFNKDEIRMIDVVAANSLFEKWKKLTGYTEEIILDQSILDKPLR
jgi:predicted transcriptional regulator